VSDLMPWLIVAAWMIVFIGGSILAVRFERRDWNDGHCGSCGERWVNFDMDSQGGRGYRCGGRHYIWITWPWVDRV